LLSAVVLTLSFTLSNGQTETPTCGAPGQWLSVAGAQSAPLAAPGLLDRLARQQVVLLGEQHDSAEDHRWQLHTLAQLHARQPAMALGLEMFPRRLQPVLDEWVAGKLDERAFLQRSEWEKVWGYDPRDYLPLLHFARMHRLPLLALNVERSLPDAVGKQGWDAVPEAQREGIGRPAAPPPAYLESLRQVFAHHPARARGEAAFQYFVEAQTLWDRAMAEPIARFLQQQPAPALVVGILGAGHVRFDHGVAHQLKALGIDQVSGLLAWQQDERCTLLTPGMADAVYVVAPPPATPPRLGVGTTPEAGGGVKITEVLPNSVAAQAGLQAGDILLTAAGKALRSNLELRTAVQRQPPGTLLPLGIRRGQEEREILARFPVEQ
jgi:uncharacterized iron-regulated protein